DPGGGAKLTSAPLVLRLALSADLDPSTLQPGDLRLVSSQDDQLGNADDTDVALGDPILNPFTHELLITPTAPLPPRTYLLSLSEASSVPRFDVTGAEGSTAPGAGADDTVATAHELGPVLDHLVQVRGAIGNDSTDTSAPATPSDVDLYHFHLDGPGLTAL